MNDDHWMGWMDRRSGSQARSFIPFLLSIFPSLHSCPKCQIHVNPLLIHFQLFQRYYFCKMKPGLAILPLEVWADVFEHPMITRQEMARIADKNRDWNFTNKLQKLLHECGKHSLRYLKIHERRAILTVSPNGYSNYEKCEFPETSMPENIKTFKRLSIGYLDDNVLDFLNKIKPLFTNVCLNIGLFKSKSTDNMHILLTHLLPMLASIRGILTHSNNGCVELLARKFPGILAQAKQLELFPKPASIPTCLNWLSAPQNFDVHGPRLLWAQADSETIFAIVDAVRKQFLAATTQSAFVIFLEFIQHASHHSADELTLENASTKEQLTVRNAIFTRPSGRRNINYVEIVRNPVGAEPKMREWIKERAFFEEDGIDENNKDIKIWDPTIGRITKQTEDDLANVQDKNADEPSTSAKGK